MNATFLKFICKDKMCRAVIPITSTDYIVECYQCGIKYDRTALLDAEPSNDDMSQPFVRRLAIRKRGPDTVKVNNLSNYYCKLLSPLLTNYGMDPATGCAQLLTEMSKGDILDCSIFKDRAFLIDPDQLDIVGFGRDVSGSMNYLSATLKIVKEANNGEERLVPIYTDGDGHCLVHAISRALVGRELFWHPLRCCLKRHFVENLTKYQEQFKDFIEPEDWKAIIEESDPDFKPPEGEMHGLRNVHIFGLANVLKRPIILLDSLECMKMSGDYSALFLPGFIPPEECTGKDNTLNKPICIAWSSFSHNHYIPLVGVQNRPLPVLPQALIPKVWGMPQDEFENYIELDGSGNCIIGGNRALTENYIQRLVKAMETMFLEKKGVHPMLVTDFKLNFCSEPAFLNVKVETLIESTRAVAEKGLLYRCLYCNSMCKIDPTSFVNPGGLSVKYDPVKNEFLPDLIAPELQNCTFCDRLIKMIQSMQLFHLDNVLKSCNVRRIKPDGTADGFTGNESYDYKPLSVSSQENELLNGTMDTKDVSSTESKSLMNKILEIDGVPHQESRLLVNKILKLEAAFGQQGRMPMDASKIDLPTKENDDMLYINFEWKGKAVTHEISDADFKKLGSTSSDCVSTLAYEIAATHFPNDYQNVHLNCLVSDEIWNQVSKAPVQKFKSPLQKFKSPVTSFKDEEKNVIVESTSEITNTAVSEPQFVKVVTPSGQQENLPLHKEGISYWQLQDWIATKFKISANNQTIKWGFPPKEFEVPIDVHKQNLPLKHGDRLMVEHSNLSVSQQKNKLNSIPQYEIKSDSDTNNMPSEKLWSVVKVKPELFRKGGTMYKAAEATTTSYIICDKNHVTLKSFPNKRFFLNAATECLELCVKLVGHFQVSIDIDERIERAKRGEHVQGVRRCPEMHGSFKEAIPARPYRKPITPSPEETVSRFIRKGPGFSCLSQPPEKMDFM